MGKRLNRKWLRSSGIFFGIFILLLCCYIEQTRPNSHYGKIFYKRARQCDINCSITKQKDYYEKAIYHNPYLSDAYYRLGILSEEEEDEAQALHWYKKAASIDHTHTEANMKVGIQYFEEKNFEKALRHLLLSDKYVRDFTDGRDNVYLGRIYERRGEYDLARKQYSKSIATGGRSDRAFIGIGAMHHLLGEHQEAFDQVVILPLQHKKFELGRQLENFIKTGEYPPVMREE